MQPDVHITAERGEQGQRVGLSVSFVVSVTLCFRPRRSHPSLFLCVFYFFPSSSSSGPGGRGPRLAGPLVSGGFPAGLLRQRRQSPCGGLLPHVGPRGPAAAVQHHSTVPAWYGSLSLQKMSPVPVTRIERQLVFNLHFTCVLHQLGNHIGCILLSRAIPKSASRVYLRSRFCIINRSNVKSEFLNQSDNRRMSCRKPHLIIIIMIIIITVTSKIFMIQISPLMNLLYILRSHSSGSAGSLQTGHGV